MSLNHATKPHIAHISARVGILAPDRYNIATDCFSRSICGESEFPAMYIQPTYIETA